MGGKAEEEGTKVGGRGQQRLPLVSTRGTAPPASLGGLGLEVGQGGSKAAKKGRGREGHPISGGPAMCQAPTRAEHAYMPEAV